MNNNCCAHLNVLWVGKQNGKIENKRIRHSIHWMIFIHQTGRLYALFTVFVQFTIWSIRFRHKKIWCFYFRLSPLYLTKKEQIHTVKLSDIKTNLNIWNIFVFKIHLLNSFSFHLNAQSDDEKRHEKKRTHTRTHTKQ